MFNLEQSIVEWRRQMIAGGVTTPELLEELESHLREEIEQQIKSGLSESEAFKIAVQNIGHAGLLKAEFKNARSFAEWLGQDKDTRINRILGLLWLIYSAGGFILIAMTLLEFFRAPNPGMTPGLLLALLLAGIYLLGIIASIRLFAGVMRERRFIKMLALLDAIGGIVAMARRPLSISPLVLTFTIMGLVTIWLLRPPQKPKLAAE